MAMTTPRESSTPSEMIRKRREGAEEGLFVSANAVSPNDYL